VCIESICIKDRPDSGHKALDVAKILPRDRDSIETMGME
jgi:hypothetical protein